MSEPQRKPPSKDPVNPPAKAPGKPPTNVSGNPQAKVPGNPPPKAPVKLQANVPGNPPTNVPVNPQAKAPVKPPTKVPGNPPPKAPSKPTAKVPVKPLSKSPVKPEEDIYAVSAPVERLVPKEEDILLTYRRPVTTVEEPPPPPSHFLSGVIFFPWHLQSLGPWIFSSAGLALSLLGVVLAIWLVDNGLTVAAYAMKFSICWVIVFAFSYLSGCLLAIIEGTASGCREITEWPRGDWRDYLFSLGYPLGALVLTALVGAAAYYATLCQSWAVPLTVGLLVYPFFFLSMLESGSVLGFVSRLIAQTYVDLWWGWLLVYAFSGAMFGGWLIWALWYFPEEPFFTTGISGPILAAMLFIYARLLGRLAWWAHEAGQSKARRKAKRSAVSGETGGNKAEGKNAPRKTSKT